MNLVLTSLAALLIGTIPSAWVFSYLFCKRDIRQMGSGNPGASNVYRECGLVPGLLTLIVDVAKGAIAILLVDWIDFGELTGLEISSLQIFLGSLAWLGHVFNPFFHFRGGKGVATLIGIFLIIFPIGLIYALLSGLVVMSVYKWFSLGSLVGVSLLPLAWWFFLDDPLNPSHYPLVVFIIVAIILTHLRHLDNTRRIIAGKENLISRKNK